MQSLLSFKKNSKPIFLLGKVVNFFLKKCFVKHEMKIPEKKYDSHFLFHFTKKKKTIIKKEKLQSD